MDRNHRQNVNVPRLERVVVVDVCADKHWQGSRAWATSAAMTARASSRMGVSRTSRVCPRAPGPRKRRPELICPVHRKWAPRGPEVTSQPPKIALNFRRVISPKVSRRHGGNMHFSTEYRRAESITARRLLRIASTGWRPTKQLRFRTSSAGVTTCLTILDELTVPSIVTI